MHSFLVVSDAGKNNYREALAHFPDESDEGEAIDLGHVEIDHDNVAPVMLEPAGGLETFCEVFTGVTFLFEVGDEKFRDGRVIVDEEEFASVARQDFHWWAFVIISILIISTKLAKCPSSVFFSQKLRAPSIRSVNFCVAPENGTTLSRQWLKIPVPKRRYAFAPTLALTASSWPAEPSFSFLWAMNFAY